MFDSSRPEDIVKFLQTNSAASLTGRSPRDAWKHYLATTTSSTGTLAELERKFLRSKGATGSSHNEMVASYCVSKGYTAGGHSSRIKAFLTTCAAP